MIKVENLEVEFKFGKKTLNAVRGVTLELKENEILGLVGESGSGKSVTAMSLLNLLSKNSSVKGHVTVFGQDIFSVKNEQLRKLRSENFGVIFQEPSTSFDPIYSIGKCFEEILRNKFPKITKVEILNKSVEALKEVKINNPAERLKNFPHQLSGGMLQRVMIALALCTDPKILIADEPTTALDVTIQSQIIRLLLEIKKNRKLSIIFISHDLELVGSISDRIAVMYGGLIMEYGSKKDVIKDTLNPYTSELIKSIPGRDQHYTDQKLYTIKGDVVNPFNHTNICPFEPRCKYAKAECKGAIPKLKQQKGHYYRCVFEKGVQHESLRN